MAKRIGGCKSESSAHNSETGVRDRKASRRSGKSDVRNSEPVKRGRSLGGCDSKFGTRTISALLGILLIFSSLPVYAFATDGRNPQGTQTSTLPTGDAVVAGAQGGADPAGQGDGAAVPQDPATGDGASVPQTHATVGQDGASAPQDPVGQTPSPLVPGSTAPQEPTANLSFQFVDSTNFTTPLLDPNDQTKSQLSATLQANQDLKVAWRMDYAINPGSPETVLPANSVSITVPALFDQDLDPKLLTGQDVEKALQELDPYRTPTNPVPLTHFTIKSSDNKETVLTNSTPINAGETGFFILTYDLNTSTLAFDANNQATQKDITAKLQANNQELSYKTLDNTEAKPLEITVTLDATSATSGTEQGDQPEQGNNALTDEAINSPELIQADLSRGLNTFLSRLTAPIQDPLEIQPEFTPIVTLADDDWTVEVKLTPPNASDGAYISGTQIKIVVNFSRTQTGDVDFDQEYSLYVNSALTALPIFRGVDSINGKPIFVIKPATSVTVDMADGNGPITYFKYVYMFNPALTQEELNTMTNTNFSATVQLITVNGETEIPNPIHVGDVEDWTVGEITIVLPIPPAATGSVSISKSVDAIYKEKSGTPGTYEISTNNKTLVQPGDIVKFNISMYDNLRNYEANAAYYPNQNFTYPVYAHLVEYLPAGYTAVQPSGTTITGIGNDLNNGWTQWNSGTNTPTLAGEELAGATTCITNGGTVWVHDYNYDTQRTDSGGTIPFYAQVKAGVTSATAAADLHNVVHSTSGSDPYNPGDREKEAGVGVDVGDKPPEPPGPSTPLDVYDLALITEILDSNPNPHFNQVFDVVGARDMTFQVLVTNQGMMPVDNVTVALYLPENIQMLDGNSIWNPTVGQINADGWTYAGTKVPQSTPQNWTPVNMYTKTLTHGAIHYPTFGPAYWQDMDHLPGREQIYNVSASWGDVDLQFHARVTGDAEEADAAVTTLSESTWIYAAEILSFTQYTGPGYLVSPTHAEYESSGNAACPALTTTWEADDLAAPMPVDVDSWPDSDPYNDLYDPRPTWNHAWGGMGISDKSSSGSGRVLSNGLEWAYSNVASNTNGGYTKELAGITDRNAKNPDYNKSGQQGPDEDDYDFAVVRVVKAKPGVDYAGSDLTKSRITWDEGHTSTVDNPGNNSTGYILGRLDGHSYDSWTGSTQYKAQRFWGADGLYKYINDDGEITDTNTAFVYKLTINAGSHDMSNMVLTDTLPEGLRYMKVNEFTPTTFTNNNNYAFYSNYYWVADELNDGSKAVIPGSQLHNRQWNVGYLNYGEISSVDQYATWPMTPYRIDQAVWLEPNNPVGTARYNRLLSADGVNVGESLANQTSYINGFRAEFTSDNSVRFTANNLHETVINLYFIVGLDSEYPLIPGHVYQNKAEMSYDGEPKKEITEDKYVTVGYDGASAFVTKYVNTATGNTNDYKGEGNYKLITSTTAEVKYRIQLRTQGSGGFEAGAININDQIRAYADAAGATINDVTGITIRAFNQNTFIPNIAANDASRVASEEGYIAAAYNNGVLNINNNEHAIEPNRLYYIEFTVNYSNIKPGANIRNTTGTTTNTVRPIDFELYKTDAANNALAGSKFELYYTDSNGQINISDPVKGALGASVYDLATAVNVVLGTADYHFNFIPKNYIPQNTWRIAFLETQTPAVGLGETPYPPGRIYYMDLVKDANGNLSWQIPAGLNGSDLREDPTVNTDNKYQFINRNTPETKAKMKIEKSWENGVTPPAEPRFAYVDPTTIPATERFFANEGSGIYTTGNLTTGYYQIIEYSPVGYGPIDSSNWTYTGTTANGDRYVLNDLVWLGDDEDTDGFGELGIGSAPNSVSKLVVENTQVGDFNLDKTWHAWPDNPDGNDNTATPPPATATRFVLVNNTSGAEYELTANGELYNATTGYSYSKNYIPQGTYTLFEYLDVAYEGYGPAKSGSGWTLTSTQNVSGYIVYENSAQIVIPNPAPNISNPNITVDNGYEDQETPAYIMVKKVDGSGSPLAGAKFKLQKLNDPSNWQTYGVANIDDQPNSGDAAGTIFIFTLPNGINRVGDYALTEEETPSGYLGLSHSLTVRIDADGKISSITGAQDDVDKSGYINDFPFDGKTISLITITNEVIPGPQIKLLKYGLGTDGIAETILSGGEFELKGTGSRSGWSSGVQIIHLDTGITFTLPTLLDFGWANYAGDYILTEISPPNGYTGLIGTATVALNADGTISSITYTDASGKTSVSKEGSNDDTIKVVDEIITGYQIKLIKTSSGTNPFNLAGAQFQLTSQKPTVAASAFWTNYASNVITIDDATAGIWFTLPTGDPSGSYTLREVTPPVGYTGIGEVEIDIDSAGIITGIVPSTPSSTASSMVSFGLDAAQGGSNILLTVRNTINPGKHIKLYKVDSTNSNRRLLGKFTLTKQGGDTWSTQETITIEANGLQFTLPAGNPAGTYLLTEDVAPAGYKRIDPITITINSDGKITSVSNPAVASITDNGISITIKDELIPGTQITIHKTAADTKDEQGKLVSTGINLQGASFRLVSNGLVGTPPANYDSGWSDPTDTNGSVTLNLPAGDPQGTYVLTEQPRSGYTGIGPVTLTIDSNGKIIDKSGAQADVDLIDIDGGGLGLRVQNKAIKGPQISLTKTNDGSNIVYLAGAVFRLIGVNPLTYDSGDVTTGSDGRVIFQLDDGDFVGTYSLTEVRPPNGYTGLTSPVNIILEIGVDGNGFGYIKETSNPSLVSVDSNKLGVTVKNSIISGKTISLKKVMNNTNETPLTGAVFELFGISPANSNATWSAGWTSGQLTVNGSGELTFQLPAGDPAGDYRLTEVTPPNGYSGLTSSVTIRIDSDGKIVGVSDGNGTIVAPGSLPNGSLIRILDTGLGIVVKNDLKPGQQINLKKTDAKGALLTGAEFTLTSTRDDFGIPPARYQSVQTVASDGTLTFNLPEGDPTDNYTLTESKVPNGYTGIAPVILTIDSNGKITHVDGVAVASIGSGANVTVSLGSYITVKNTIKPGSKISLSKTAANGNTQLSGAQFTLIGVTPGANANWGPGTATPTYSDGPYTANNTITFTLPDGDPSGFYTLREDVAPNGYERMQDVTLEIDSAGKVVRVTGADAGLVEIQNGQISIKVLNNIKAGRQISLIKQNANGSTNLAGATFKLTGDIPAPATVSPPYPGATWTSYTDTQTITSANNGLTFNLPAGDPAGTYILEELVAPNGYTLGLSAPVTLTIDSEGRITAPSSGNNIVVDGDKLGLRVRNTIKDGLPIQLIKTDASGNTRLRDAVFTLSWSGITSADPTTGVDTQTTLTNGTLTFTLPKGTPEGVYTLHEVTAPNGYQAISDVYLHINNLGKITKITVGADPTSDVSTVVTLNGTAGASITARDTIRPGLEIDLTKYGPDPGTGVRLPLAGAKFQLSVPATGYKSAIIETDTNGKLLSKFKLPDGNPAGTYFLTEVQAPVGYLPMASVTLVIDSAGNVTVQNYGDGSTPPVYVGAGGTAGELVNLIANNNDKLYDAALRKWVSGVYGKDDSQGVLDSISTANAGTPSNPVKVRRGDIVEYTIKVFNQCEWPMIITGLVDDLPTGTTFDFAESSTLNSGWTQNADGKLYYTPASGQIALAKKGTVNDADTAFVHLYLKVIPEVYSNTVITNFAEITGETDEDGNIVKDVDSTPDSELDNDGSETNGDLKDNEIDEHRDGIDGDKDYGDYGQGKDEDDHDIAKILVEDEPILLVAKKTIAGLTTTNEVFSFTLQQVTSASDDTAPAGAVASQTKTTTVPVTSAGQLVAFDQIEGLAPNASYFFRITEDAPATPALGWTYSTASYLVRVDIDQYGGIVITYPDGFDAQTPLLFENSYIVPVISVQVDKDTIRRTSAAYNSLPGHEEIYNVGVEQYKYEIDFRSTSTIPADEFVVDDPLENLDPSSASKVKLEALWTPVVWGDGNGDNGVGDGLFYVLYKTNLTPAGFNPGVEASGLASPQYSNAGYELWPIAQPLQTTTRYRLNVADLGLAAGEYLTGLRFDYGAVDVGFTSRLGLGSGLNGEYRDGHHELPTLPGGNGNLDLLAQPAVAPLSGEVVALGALAAEQEQGVSTLDTANLEIATSGLSPLDLSDEFNNWSAAPNTSAAGFVGSYRPAAYLVSATAAMNEVNIDSSVSARIARSGIPFNAALHQDQDAVRTLEIPTFTAGPPEGAYELGDLDSSFVDNLLEAGYTIRGGAWYDPQGNPLKAGFPQTGDDKTLFLFLAIMMSELGVALLLLALLADRRRRRVRGNQGGYTARKVVSGLMSILLAALLLVPMVSSTAFAAPGDDDDVNVTVEYRYAEGETPDIPARITQLGREYRLISQAAPVLEDTLPATRTYTYRIDGALSPEDLATVADIPGLVVTPVEEVRERRVDKTDLIANLPTNDVEQVYPGTGDPVFPEQRAFMVTSGTDASGYETASLRRAGLAFTVLTEEDGLPLTYGAKAVYRGVETYSAVAYYLAESTYTTEIPDGETNQYVIVAIYEPVNPPVAVELIPAEPEPEGSPLDLEFTAEELAWLNAQSGNPLVDIANAYVPLGNLQVTGAWSFVSLLFAIVGVFISLALAVSGLVRRKLKPDLGKYDNEDEQGSKPMHSLAIKAITIVLGLAIVIVWLVLDDITLHMVWINNWTLVVGTLLVVQIAALIFYIFFSKERVKQGVQTVSQ